MMVVSTTENSVEENAQPNLENDVVRCLEDVYCRPLIGPGFSIGASPSSLTILIGSSAFSTINLIGHDGFHGIVRLATQTYPSGLTFSPRGLNTSLSVPVVDVIEGTPAKIRLDARSSTIGYYTVNVTATTTISSRSLLITVRVVDFDMCFLRAPQCGRQGSLIVESRSASVDLSLASLNGFSGSIALLSSVSDRHLDISIDTPRVSLRTYGTTSITLNLKFSKVANYTVIIIGSAGTLAHRISFTVRLVGLTISANSPVLTLKAGYRITPLLILTSINDNDSQMNPSGKLSPSKQSFADAWPVGDNVPFGRRTAHTSFD